MSLQTWPNSATKREGVHGRGRPSGASSSASFVVMGVTGRTATTTTTKTAGTTATGGRSIHLGGLFQFLVVSCHARLSRWGSRAPGFLTPFCTTQQAAVRPSHESVEAKALMVHMAPMMAMMMATLTHRSVPTALSRLGRRVISNYCPSLLGI